MDVGASAANEAAVAAEGRHQQNALHATNEAALIFDRQRRARGVQAAQLSRKPGLAGPEPGMKPGLDWPAP